VDRRRAEERPRKSCVSVAGRDPSGPGADRETSSVCFPGALSGLSLDQPGPCESAGTSKPAPGGCDGKRRMVAPDPQPARERLPPSPRGRRSRFATGSFNNAAPPAC
jgi:hypothetical protein